MAVYAILAMAAAASAGGVVGQWQFNNNLNGDVGSTALSHGSLSYETAVINGKNATVARVGDLAHDGGTTNTYGTNSNVQFVNPIGWSPSGQVFNVGGNAVWGLQATYQYTILMDIKVPSAPDWIGLMDTMIDDTQNSGNSAWEEADLWIKNSDRSIGVAGAYAGAVPVDQWMRVAISADMGTYMDNHNANGKLNVYINGTLVNAMNNSYFGEVWPNRWALQKNFQLFGDPTNYSTEMLVNSVQLRDYAMNAKDIAALGGPTAAGIGAVPEPTSMLALGLGLLGIVARRRRR